MTTAAEQFATIILKYSTERGIDFLSLSRENQDNVVRNWYLSQKRMMDKFQENPNQFIK